MLGVAVGCGLLGRSAEAEAVQHPQGTQQLQEQGSVRRCASSFLLSRPGLSGQAAAPAAPRLALG